MPYVTFKAELGYSGCRTAYCRAWSNTQARRGFLLSMSACKAKGRLTSKSTSGTQGAFVRALTKRLLKRLL